MSPTCITHVVDVMKSQYSHIHLTHTYSTHTYITQKKEACHTNERVTSNKGKTNEIGCDQTPFR